MAPLQSLKDSISKQREAISQMLHLALEDVAIRCGKVWGDREALNQILEATIKELPYVKFMYVLDTDAIQKSDNITQTKRIEADYGRDRSQRPYMRQAVPSTEFLLSEAYISLRARRPSLTAIQIVRSEQGKALGFVGVDFDLRNLPIRYDIYEEPSAWRQVKGDPAIRGTVFHQTRTDSPLDLAIQDVTGVMEELITENGVFQALIHFSSSRATIWLYNDPYRYRLLDVEALTDPDICLAYPTLTYPSDAVIPKKKIRAILDTLAELRLMDDMFYLRSSSINIFNGIVSLTFSCDGSHYIPYDEFLDKNISFWIGAATK
ncbi:MAG: PDC sensor domain-containing protein [Gammaproteobacteria bacterium]|nr:PDC sensor domain-containing protein [Gammaproteobacteria bacterium]